MWYNNCSFDVVPSAVFDQVTELLGSMETYVKYAFILFLYNIIVTAEYYSKKTSYIMIGTMIAAIINIITNYLFINKYGFIAAAYTTLFSYFCYLILHIIISRKLLGFFVIKIKWLVLYIGIVCGVAILFLIFINSIFVRWGLCVLLALPMSVKLIKVSGVLNRK